MMSTKYYYEKYTPQ